MITTKTAETIINQAREQGNSITLLTSDGSTVTGEAVSVNSKGVNLRVDGKVKSVSIKRIDKITQNVPGADGEGMTTADLAEMFEISAKELRVHLRHLGLGVGKGQRYALTERDLDKVRDRLATVDA